MLPLRVALFRAGFGRHLLIYAGSPAGYEISTILKAFSVPDLDLIEPGNLPDFQDSRFF